MRRLLLLVALAATATACGDGAEDGGADATRSMVLETCAPGGDPVEVEICRCAHDELAERYDADALADLDQDLRDDPETVPDAVEEIVLGCAFERVAPPPTPTTRPKPTTTSSSTTSTTDPDDGDRQAGDEDAAGAFFGARG